MEGLGAADADRADDVGPAAGAELDRERVARRGVRVALERQVDAGVRGVERRRRPSARPRPARARRRCRGSSTSGSRRRPASREWSGSGVDRRCRRPRRGGRIRGRAPPTRRRRCRRPNWGSWSTRRLWRRAPRPRQGRRGARTFVPDRSSSCDYGSDCVDRPTAWTRSSSAPRSVPHSSTSAGPPPAPRSSGSDRHARRSGRIRPDDPPRWMRCLR